MPQDAFTLKFIAKELEELLLGGKISKIIQPSREELTFIIYTRKGNVKLKACLSARAARLSVENGEDVAPQVAPNFCMLLRKHLQNAEIIEIKQIECERIIYFDFACTYDFSSSVMRLYFEIMGKYSNAVLTENGVISGALKTTAIDENTKRVLFGGMKYALPEAQDKTGYENLQELENALRTVSGDAAKFISDRVRGISYSTALDMVAEFGESPTAKQVYGYIHGEKAPCVIFENGTECDFKARSCATNKKSYPTVLEAQRAYYESVLCKRAFAQEKTRLDNALNSALKKIEKRIENSAKKLEECNGAEEIKLKGELIIANIYRLERGAAGFTAVNYYDPESKEIKIDLDRTLTPSQNAQKYYKKYAKLKRTQTAVSVQRKEEENKKDYILSVAAHISAAENADELKIIAEEMVAAEILKPQNAKENKPETKPFREFETRGFKIIAGRSNIENDKLTKSLSPEDIWLHTQKYHSSHVAVICNGNTVPDDILKIAAEICAYYSEGREGAKIPVDYTKKKFVKKPPKSNAGFAVYTDYSTVLVDPDPHADIARKI